MIGHRLENHYHDLEGVLSRGLSQLLPISMHGSGQDRARSVISDPSDLSSRSGQKHHECQRRKATAVRFLPTTFKERGNFDNKSNVSKTIQILYNRCLDLSSNFVVNYPCRNTINHSSSICRSSSIISQPFHVDLSVFGSISSIEYRISAFAVVRSLYRVFVNR